MRDHGQVEFGKRLIAVRLAYSTLIGSDTSSRAWFSSLIGLKQDAYRRYELGETEPTLRTLQKIKEVTGISLDWLLTGQLTGYDTPSQFTRQCTVSFGERVRILRELFEPDIDKAAAAMRVPTRTMERWEQNIELMTVEKMEEFCHRFSGSLDFLIRGMPVGMRPAVLSQLLSHHPNLWAADDTGTGTDSCSSGLEDYGLPNGGDEAVSAESQRTSSS